MQAYKITYSGKNAKFKNIYAEIEATHERAAVVKYFSKNCPDGYFPEFGADGDIECIYDADGDCIMSAGQTSIYYDGGYFEAELITGE